MGISTLRHNTGEALAFVCFACLVVSAMRWRAVRRKDTLIAIDLVLAGIILLELTVWRFGTFAWTADSAPHFYSTLSRALMLAGVIVFIRRLCVDARYGEWVAPGLLAVAFAFAMIVA